MDGNISEKSPAEKQEKNTQLYLRQKKLLDEFLHRGAISQAQYDKSFGDLTDKMGMQDFAAEIGWRMRK